MSRRGGSRSKADHPLAPRVMALVLGGLMEKSFRQALISAQGDPMTLLERPISAAFLGLAALLFLAPLVKAFIKRRGDGGVTTPAQ